jgi:hypothetical protein
VANIVAGADEREVAGRRIVDLGFAYPDALDLRHALTRGNHPGPAQGTVSKTSSARPCLTPDHGPVAEPTAAHPQSQSAEDAHASVGGTP